MYYIWHWGALLSIWHFHRLAVFKDSKYEKGEVGKEVSRPCLVPWLLEKAARSSVTFVEASLPGRLATWGPGSWPLGHWPWLTLSSVQFSRSVVSDSLRPHESQHARPPCPSSTPRVHPDSRPSSQWSHPAISSSVVPFSSCPQSLHQSLFQWVNSWHEVAKVLEFQL